LAGSASRAVAAGAGDEGRYKPASVEAIHGRAPTTCLKLALGHHRRALIAFVGLLALANAGVGLDGRLVWQPQVTLQSLLAWLFLPLVWISGLPPSTTATKPRKLLRPAAVARRVPAFVSLAEQPLQAGRM